MSNFTVDININAPELSAAITALAVAMSGDSTQQTYLVKETVSEQAPEPAQEPKPKAKPKPKPEQKAEPVIPLETVRAKLTALSRDGKQAQVKTLITKFGAKKLTEIPAEKYPELLEAARSI